MVRSLFTHPRILVPGAHAAVSGADAILVDGGRIVAVGPRQELRAAPGIAAEIALPGAAIVAGFHDAHIHSGSVARGFASLDLRGVASLDKALAAVQVWAAAHPSDGWIIGGRYDSNRWPTGTPTRHDLDAVCPDRPVALASLDGHSAWLNTAGLRAAGIDRDTADPAGGDIFREADGREPAGVVRESVADAVRELSEAWLAPELPGLLLRAQEHLLSLGITQITDLDEDATRRAYESLHEDGRLVVRVSKGIPMADLAAAIAEGRRTGAGDSRLSVGPVKLFADGALGSHSAHMCVDFADDPGNAGIEVLPLEQLVGLVRAANTAGIAVATHAIGDRANRLVLDAYEANVDVTRANGLRNRVEHAQHIDPSDVLRFAELGVVASLQPTHCATDYLLAEQRIGTRKLANYAWRSLLDSGAAVAFGSDAPIEPVNPMLGVHAAVTRQDLAGRPPGGFEPEERISVLEALEAYSAGSAYAAGLENAVGRIAPTQLADFVALSADPTSVPPAELAGITVAATVVGGELAFAAGS